MLCQSKAVFNKYETVYDATFDELHLPAEVCEEMRQTWQDHKLKSNLSEFVSASCVPGPHIKDGVSRSSWGSDL